MTCHCSMVSTLRMTIGKTLRHIEDCNEFLPMHICVSNGYSHLMMCHRNLMLSTLRQSYLGQWDVFPVKMRFLKCDLASQFKARRSVELLKQALVKSLVYLDGCILTYVVSCIFPSGEQPCNEERGDLNHLLSCRKLHCDVHVRLLISLSLTVLWRKRCSKAFQQRRTINSTLEIY